MTLDRAPSLRGRLFSWLIGPIVALAVITAITAYFIGFRFANEVYDRWISDNAVALSQLVRTKDGVVTLDLPEQAQHMLASDQQDRVYFRVTNAAGDLVAGYRGLPAPTGLVPGGPPACFDATLEGSRVRVAAFLVADRSAVVEVAETTVKRDQLARQIMAEALLPVLGIILLAVVGVWFGVNRGLAPLVSVTDEIGKRKATELGPVDEGVAPREIRPIVRALNSLLGRVDIAVQAQRRFVADAAHQLRTPLAGLKTQAELALRTTDPSKIEASLRQIAIATDRTTRLVNQLLSLARSEPEGLKKIDLQSVNLHKHVREITADWIARALEKGIDLGFEGADAHTEIDADPVLLRELANNLIGNALTHCPSGSIVTVSVRRAGQQVEFAVTDDGPGIPEDERERVFERFHRVMGSEPSGSGLGLSIVKQIAEAHRADVAVTSSASGRGTRITVTFLAKA